MRRNITFTMCAMLAIVAAVLAVRAPADEPAPTGQMYVYSGILRGLDLQARTVTVDGAAIPQKFAVPTDAEIIVKTNRGALSAIS